MRRTAVLMIALALTAAGCGGGEDSACAGIADDTIGLFQELVDEFDGKTFAELAEVDGEAIEADLAAQYSGLETRADAAGCSDDDMADLVRARLGNLQADSEIGQSIIDSIRVEN